MKKFDTIKVTKDGDITGVGRFTEIPFAALALADNNMIFPSAAEEKEFECTRSDRVRK